MRLFILFKGARAVWACCSNGNWTNDNGPSCIGVELRDRVAIRSKDRYESIVSEWRRRRAEGWTRTQVAHRERGRSIPRLVCWSTKVVCIFDEEKTRKMFGGTFGTSMNAYDTYSHRDSQGSRDPNGSSFGSWRLIVNNRRRSLRRRRRSSIINKDRGTANRSWRGFRSCNAVWIGWG